MLICAIEILNIIIIISHRCLFLGDWPDCFTLKVDRVSSLNSTRDKRAGKVHAHARDTDDTGGERGSFARNHALKTKLQNTNHAEALLFHMQRSMVTTVIIILIPFLIQFDIVKHMRQDQITNGLVHAISSVRTPYLLLLLF